MLDSFFHRLWQALIDVPIALATLAIFVSAGTIRFCLFRRTHFTVYEFLRYCLPFSSWCSNSARVDVYVFFANKILSKAYAWLVPATLIGASYLSGACLSSYLPHATTSTPNVITYAWCSLCLFLVSDFTYFLTHYLEHHVAILWEAHKVHHSATFLNPLTARRVHPLAFVFEELTNAGFTGIVVGFFTVVIDFNLIDIFFLYLCASKIPAIVTLDILKHSHFSFGYGPLEMILISPRIHHLHHSCKPEHLNRNFGVKLVVWDRIFGTFYKPQKDEEMIYGLFNQEEQNYHSIWTVYANPVVGIWNIVSRRTHPAQLLETSQVKHVDVDHLSDRHRQ